MVREYSPMPSVPNNLATNITDPNCKKADSSCLLNVINMLKPNFLFFN